MNKIYGYCRISTSKQNIERQIRNILKEFPDAIIIQETFTGSKFQGRKELDKLIKGGCTINCVKGNHTGEQFYKKQRKN